MEAFVLLLMLSSPDFDIFPSFFFVDSGCSFGVSGREEDAALGVAVEAESARDEDIRVY